MSESWRCGGCGRQWAPHMDFCRACDGTVATASNDDPSVWRLWFHWLGQLDHQISRRTQEQLAPTTRTLYRRHTKQMLMTRIVRSDGSRVRFGHLRWSELGPTMSTAFRSAGLAAGWKGNYINRILCTLNACLSWHADSGLKLGRNPMHGSKMADERQFRRRTRLSLEDWQRFLSHGPPILQDIGYVAYRSYGLRPTEASQLRKSELDTARKMIVLTKRLGCKTGAREIAVPLDAWEILERRNAESRGDYVFVNPLDPRRQRPISTATLQRWFRLCRENSGVEGYRGERITAYVGRHSGLNAAISASIPIAHVAASAGSQVKTIEDNYLTVTVDDHERGRRLLEAEPARKPPARAQPSPPMRMRARGK